MLIIFSIVFFADMFCFIKVDEFFQSLENDHNDTMKDKEIVLSYINCFAIISQYKVKNLNFENFQDWVNYNLNMLSINETVKYFYFEFLKTKRIKLNYSDDYKYKIEFPTLIFNKNTDNLDKLNQNFNDIELTKELQKDTEHFFFYSNFDAVKDVPLLIDEIFVLSKNLSPDHSVSIFVFKNLVLKDRLNNLKDYYENTKDFIFRYKITNQLVYVNNDSSKKKEIKAQNLIKTIDEFEKKNT